MSQEKVLQFHKTVEDTIMEINDILATRTDYIEDPKQKFLVTTRIINYLWIQFHRPIITCTLDQLGDTDGIGNTEECSRDQRAPDSEEGLPTSG